MTSENLPEPLDVPRSRVNSIVTTFLLIMISIMIVRDIFVRRWGAAAPPAADVTQPSGEGLRASVKSP
jgi:hypothetical protein